MASDSKKEITKRVRRRNYLAKDFDNLRASLLDHARTYFPNQIRDFSEASLGGLLLDFAAYVGDVQSFYLDHQFHELNIETAVETRNIEALLRASDVPIVGASPAVVETTFYIQVPATSENPPQPNRTALPILHAGTVVRADNGTQFELVDDIDFRDTDDANKLVASVVVGDRNANNVPTNFILSRSGICISGFRATDSFSIGSFEKFKQYTMSKENITEVINVEDNLGNIYYEVENLTNDTVFEALTNRTRDNQLVKDILVPTPAPYRFVKKTSLDTRLTTLTFGGGSAETTNDDIIPDPSELAVPLYGKKTFTRFSINPNNLLKTTTMGVVQPNSTITITYRHGGGLSHNVPAQSIQGVDEVAISFPASPDASVSQFVRASLDATNLSRASGGEDAPSVQELKQRAPAVRASQKRIASKEDILARIYTMPSNFGRVFRASVEPDPINPISSRLYIISRNAQNQLIISPDSLKKNLRTYLNSFRFISDAIDILDVQVINVKVEFSFVADPNLSNKNLVLQNVLARLRQYFNIKNFEINQPIVLADLQNIIFNNPGVLSVNKVTVKNLTGTVGDRQYSRTEFSVQDNTDRGMIFGPQGSMFEVKYKDFDLEGVVY